MTVNLCEPMLFGLTRKIENGCAVDCAVSLERVLTTPEYGGLTGDCKHLCADIVFDRATGTDRVAFTSNVGLLSVSDFGVLGDVPSILPTWSKRAGAEGTDVSPSRGTLRGGIATFTSSSDCTIAARDVNCYNLNPLLVPPGPPWVPNACFVYPYGLDCVYGGAFWDLDCTIEVFPMARQMCATTAQAWGARIPIYLPGARLIPDADSWDITGDAEPFYAGDGLDGKVRYYLKSFTGAVEPYNLLATSFPSSLKCCTFLTNWTQTGALDAAWRLFCNSPLQHAYHEPALSELTPRRFDFNWFPGMYSLIHFNFPTLQPCFPLADQYCLTDGGDADEGSQWWEHLSPFDSKLTVLDHVAIDLSNVRFSTDQEAHPYAEPEMVAIINDALWETSRHVWQVGQNNPNQGHQRSASYDSHSLNLWYHSAGFGDCEVKPVVCYKNDPETARTVFVTPYGTTCRFPADLVLDRMSIQLRISFEPRNIQAMGEDPVTPGVRLPATCDIYLWLLARLRPGWESINCPVEFASAQYNACNLETSPSVPVVISADGCSQVPLVIHWRGINGPPPWSRSTFEHQSFLDAGGHALNSVACCDFLCALHGLLIPAEVRNTADPAGPQPYEGDVYIEMNTNPHHNFGCRCEP